jgi:hypothetical protein
MNKNVFFQQFIGLPVVKTDKIVKLLVLDNIRWSMYPANMSELLYLEEN